MWYLQKKTPSQKIWIPLGINTKTVSHVITESNRIIQAKPYASFEYIFLSHTWWQHLSYVLISLLSAFDSRSNVHLYALLLASFKLEEYAGLTKKKKTLGNCLFKKQPNNHNNQSNNSHMGAIHWRILILGILQILLWLSSSEPRWWGNIWSGKFPPTNWSGREWQALSTEEKQTETEVGDTLYSFHSTWLPQKSLSNVPLLWC